MSDKLTPYKKLVTELETATAQLKELYVKRDSAQAEITQSKSERAVTCDLIVDNPEQDYSELLERLDRSLTYNQAQITGLTPRIERREVELQQLCSAACETFGRLYQAVRDRIYDNAVVRISELVHSSNRAAQQMIVEQLALTSTEYVDAVSMQPPMGDSWHIIGPLPTATSATNGPARQERMSAILQTMVTLLNCGNQLITKSEMVGSNVPDYMLGKLPEAKSIPSVDVLAWNEPLGGSEIEIARQICEAGGKDYDNLTDHDKRILMISLENHRNQYGKRSQLTRVNSQLEAS